MSYWCLQYRRKTLIIVFALSLLTLLLFYESKRPYFQWVCRLVTQAFPRVHRTSNQRDSLTSNTKQGNFKRPLPQGNCLNKNGKMFPCCPVCYYIHTVHLDKLSQYALTEVKHRFSNSFSKTRSNSLKPVSVQIIFCHSCSQRNRSKTRELSQNKDIFMILRQRKHRKHHILPVQWYSL